MKEELITILYEFSNKLHSLEEKYENDELPIKIDKAWELITHYLESDT